MRRFTFTRSLRRRTTALSAVAILIAIAAIAAIAAPSAQAAPYPEYPYAATDYTEPFRGQFHFSPQSGWMNDINAPLYYHGVYHLFYQHNPHGLYWDTMHWGHATSTDLVHWTQQPIALEPGTHNATLFSGAGWVDIDNVTGLKTGADDPILLFTNTNGVSIAYSTDGARTFQMYNGGAKVISIRYESRDPKVIWDAARNRWVMVLLGQRRRQRRQVLQLDEPARLDLPRRVPRRLALRVPRPLPTAGRRRTPRTRSGSCRTPAASTSSAR